MNPLQSQQSIKRNKQMPVFNIPGIQEITILNRYLIMDVAPDNHVL